jgi:hypothetical protein
MAREQSRILADGGARVNLKRGCWPLPAGALIGFVLIGLRIAGVIH